MDNMGVMPVLNPTVPMALTCSKARSKKVQALAFNSADSVKVYRKTPQRFPTKKNSSTLYARDRNTSLMVRLKI